MTAFDLLRALVLPDGRKWGEAAADFQLADAQAVLSDTGPPYSFLTRSRGSSKTTDLAGVALALLLTLERERLFWLAADADQGALALDAIRGFVLRTPQLDGALDLQARRVVAHSTGSSLDVLPADAAGAWGLLPRFVICDELAWWTETAAPQRLWEAVSSAVAKRDDARLVVLTTASDPGHWSRAVLDHALEDPMWHVHEVPGPAPWLSEDRLAEQRRRLSESMYMRLFENRWVTSEDRLTTRDDLLACVTLDGPLDYEAGHQYVIGLDLGLTHDATVAVVAHVEPAHGSEDGRRVVLDRLRVWQGSRTEPVQLAEIEEWVEQAAGVYHARVVTDPWQAAGLAQRLRVRGVQVEEFTFSAASVGRLGSTLHVLLRNRALALPNDPRLLDELGSVRLIERAPGVLRLDHDAGKHDDTAVALALAAYHLIEEAAYGQAAFVPTDLLAPGLRDLVSGNSRNGRAADPPVYGKRNFCDCPRHRAEREALQ